MKNPRPSNSRSSLDKNINVPTTSGQQRISGAQFSKETFAVRRKTFCSKNMHRLTTLRRVGVPPLGESTTMMFAQPPRRCSALSSALAKLQLPINITAGGSTSNNSSANRRRRRSSCIDPARRNFHSSRISGEHLSSPRFQGCGRPKTAVLVELTRKDHRPGALNRILQVFEQHGVQLTHIESKFFTFAYDGVCFHLHADGRATDPKVQKVLMEVRNHCANVEVLPPCEVSKGLLFFSGYFCCGQLFAKYALENNFSSRRSEADQKCG